MILQLLQYIDDKCNDLYLGTNALCLTDHLVGTKHCNHDNVSRVRQDTNCRIITNYDGSLVGTKGVPTKPITIDIGHPMQHIKSSRVCITVRRRLEDILMNFRPTSPSDPAIKEDGSKGRLLYEIAASCGGPHRPNGSTSRAVNQLNPFDPNQKHCYMSILELPYTGSGSNKIFHGRFLLENKVSENVKNLTGCSFKVIGDEFGPIARYCDPYILILGQQWAKVDKAVVILANEIRKHSIDCGCS